MDNWPLWKFINVDIEDVISISAVNSTDLIFDLLQIKEGLRNKISGKIHWSYN